jgi:hypothetical protein
VLASYKISGLSAMNKIYHCIYHSDDVVCAVGNAVFRSFKINGDTLKPRDTSLFKKENKEMPITSQNYLSCCILPQENNMIIGTDQGELLLVNQNLEFKMVIPTSPFDGFSIECIIPTQKGFMIGGPDCVVYIYEKLENDPKTAYKRFDRRVQVSDLRSFENKRV